MEATRSNFPFRPVQALWLFWFSLFAVLLFDVYLIPSTISDSGWFVIMVKAGFNGLVALWIAADASDRNWSTERVTLFSVLSMVFAEIAVLVYLIKSRGWTGAARSVIRFVFYALIFIVLLLLVGQAVENTLGVVPD